jgi:hypothetical protein
LAAGTLAARATCIDHCLLQQGRRLIFLNLQRRDPDFSSSPGAKADSLAYQLAYAAQAVAAVRAGHACRRRWRRSSRAAMPRRRHAAPSRT